MPGLQGRGSDNGFRLVEPDHDSDGKSTLWQLIANIVDVSRRANS
jgi:hypothetical protein